jgi:Fe-S-cluster-containing dehydrogenase component
VNKFHLIIDIALCEDCNCCFLACKDEYVDNEWPGYSAAQPLHGQRWMNIHRTERGTYPIVDAGYLPQPCMHCDTAPCVGAGGGAVVKRKDGLVLIDPKKAIGNKKIVAACPYDAIWWNEEKQLAQKCTGCAHLLDTGWKEPRCVQVCPTGALRSAYMEDSELQKMIVAEGLEPLHPEYETKPIVYYKNLHRYAKCFIGGSVVVRNDGVEDCLPNARVTLFMGNKKVGEAVSDTYGEFKIDRLERGSGPYRVEISANGAKQSVDVAPISNSVYLGVLAFGKPVSVAAGTK